MGILKIKFKIPSLSIQCCKHNTYLDAAFSHCFSTLLKGGREQKHKIVQIALLPIISVKIDFIKKSQKLSVTFSSSLFYFEMKVCNYSFHHNFGTVRHYLNNRVIIQYD